MCWVLILDSLLVDEQLLLHHPEEQCDKMRSYSRLVSALFCFLQQGPP